MKTTQMAKFDIPSQLVKQDKVEREDLSLSLASGRDASNLLKWNALNYTGVASTGVMIGLNVFTGFEALFLTLSILLGTATAISMLVNIVTLLFTGQNTLGYVMRNLQNLSQPITANDLEKQTYSVGNKFGYKTYNGIKVKQKTRRFQLIHFFLPVRIFKKQLISESLWYHPVDDVYRKKSVYLTANTLVRDVEIYHGSRYQFKQALENI